MTLYRILVFVHVLGAAAWVGGGLYNYLHGLTIRAAKDPARMASFAYESQQFAGKYFAPAALVTALAGIWLVYEGDWGWEHFWIVSGLVVWIYSIVSNVTWLSKLADRLQSLIAERGAVDPEVRAAGQQMFRWRTLEVALLVFVIFAMTYKPFA
ncbi:MAG: DUF2269 family protein [Actinomycetota bacterium]